MRNVNITGWKNKKSAIDAYNRKAFPLLVKLTAQAVRKQAVDNLSGPHIKPGIPGSADDRIGQEPVPRRTSMLVRSIKTKVNNWLSISVLSDSQVAPWNWLVHDGTKYMKPRRFMKNAVEKIQYTKYLEYKNDYKKGLRKIGRA